MKLYDALNEEPTVTGLRYPGGGMGTWSSVDNKGYSRIEAKKKADVYDNDESPLDPHIEQQLINQAIDLFIQQHPELAKNKKIRRHHLQMLIGSVTSGEVNDLISLKNMIKGLKKRKIKVENGIKLRDCIAEEEPLPMMKKYVL